MNSTFPNLQNIRPGIWVIQQLGNRGAKDISDFVQYEHLSSLKALSKASKELAAALGNDYTVAPDIVIYREPLGDDMINKNQVIVCDDIAKATSLRSCNSDLPILHSSISAKITMRSDRAQNSRTEALNLIRNRKGHLPHVVVCTAEPLPGRLASLALGTGDIDCVYHACLYELVDAVNSVGSEDAKDILDTLISGKRLKDISDLPLDLAI